MQTLTMIGKRIQRRRKFLKITQRELANHLFISRTKLSEYENGHREMTMGDARSLSKALRMPMQLITPDHLFLALHGVNQGQREDLRALAMKRRLQNERMG